MRGSRGGFTVVEVMIVVCVLALLAVIAVPNLVRGRHDAAEAAAQESLRQLMTAMIQYKTAEPPYTYPNDLAFLGPTPDGDLGYINELLAAGSYQGYRFIVAATPDAFTIRAFPERPGVTGTRMFAINDSGEVSEIGEGP